MEEIEIQLQQLHGALSVAGEADKPVLLQLISDLEQLVGQGSSANRINNGTADVASGDNPSELVTSQVAETEEDEEFRRFQVSHVITKDLLFWYLIYTEFIRCTLYVDCTVSSE